MEKAIRSFSIDGVRTDEPFDLAFVLDAQTGLIKIPDLREFVGDRFIWSDAVEMPALNHEGAGTYQPSHLGVVERASEIPLEDLVFALVRITVAQ